MTVRGGVAGVRKVTDGMTRGSRAAEDGVVTALPVILPVTIPLTPVIRPVISGRRRVEDEIIGFGGRVIDLGAGTFDDYVRKAESEARLSTVDRRSTARPDGGTVKARTAQYVADRILAGHPARWFQVAGFEGDASRADGRRQGPPRGWTHYVAEENGVIVDLDPRAFDTSAPARTETKASTYFRNWSAAYDITESLEGAGRGQGAVGQRGRTDARLTTPGCPWAPGEHTYEYGGGSVRYRVWRPAGGREIVDVLELHGRADQALANLTTRAKQAGADVRRTPPRSW